MDFTPLSDPEEDLGIGLERTGMGPRQLSLRPSKRDTPVVAPSPGRAPSTNSGFMSSGDMSFATSFDEKTDDDFATTDESQASKKKKKKKDKSSRKKLKKRRSGRGSSPGLNSSRSNRSNTDSSRGQNSLNQNSSGNLLGDDDSDLGGDSEMPLKLIDEEEIDQLVNSRSAIELFEKGRIAARRKEEGLLSMDSRSRGSKHQQKYEEARQRMMETKSRGTETSNLSRDEYIQNIMMGKASVSSITDAPLTPVRGGASVGASRSLAGRSLGKVEEQKVTLVDESPVPKSFVPSDWPEEKPKKKAGDFDNMVIEVESHHSDILPPPPPPQESYANSENFQGMAAFPENTAAPTNKFPDYEQHYNGAQEVVMDAENPMGRPFEFHDNDPKGAKSMFVYAESEKPWYQNSNTRFSIAMVLILVIGAAIGITFLVKVPPSRDEVALTREQVLLFSDISDGTTLRDVTSPQYKAAQFVATADNLDGVTDLKTERPALLQRYSMAVLYYSLTQESAGDALDGWVNERANECEWGSRVVCSKVATAPQVEGLDLSSAKLAGTIPREIEFLTNLKSLILSNNELVGTIPKSMGTLLRLETMDLERNFLSGILPSEIRVLTLLKHLDLSHNKLAGLLPNEVVDLFELTSLDLSFNIINGSIPDALRSLSLLKTLDLRNNRLSGTIPRIFGHLIETEFLHLDYNQLTGSLPQDYDFLGRFISVSASHNLLSGAIPEVVPFEETQAALEALLAGAFKLRDIDLSGNFLTGTIPSLIALLPALETMNMASNAFEGPVTGFKGSSSARELYFGDNLFTGGLPSVFAVNLESIDYAGNNLNGTIPATLRALEKLTNLNLGRNLKLTGTVPTDFAGSLRVLNLEECGFVGQFPAGLTAYTQLEHLILGGNMMSGTIPRDMEKLFRLSRLDLGSNSIQGSIPPELANCGLLEILELESNSLRGNIPTQLATLGNLHTAFLQDNTLEGTFPGSLCEMRSVTNFRVDCLVQCECCVDYCN